MGIKGLLETSFVDWPGRVCAVVFLSGCNFRCPYCHNHELVLQPESLASLAIQEVREQLRRLQHWLGGICVTGGEPTLDPGLVPMLQLFKEDGWSIKLDTNGSRPSILAELLAKGLVDMVAMDVKAPLDQEKYDRCAGVRVHLPAIQESMNLLRQSEVDHQFRMTVLPLFHSQEDVLLCRHAVGQESSLTLQNFRPRSTLEPSLAEGQPFVPQAFEDLCAMVRSNA